MAWDEIEFCGHQGVSGDKPVDEMAAALSRIAELYQGRIHRKPSLAELLYALRTVILAAPERFVIDAQSLGRLKLDAPPPPMSLDLADYDGGFADDSTPGVYLVQRRSTNQDVLRVPKIEVEGRTLICEYQILDPAIDSRNAELLIHLVLLEGFCNRYYESKADVIEFRRV